MRDHDLATLQAARRECERLGTQIEEGIGASHGAQLLSTLGSVEALLDEVMQAEPVPLTSTEIQATAAANDVYRSGGNG